EIAKVEKDVMKDCSYCGREYDDAAGGCECGLTELVVVRTPPVPETPARPAADRRYARRWMVFCVLMGSFVVGILVLRLLGLICPFSIPAGSMAPALARGDRVFMEGFSFLSRKPRRGDIVVFKTQDNPFLEPNTYVDRVVGEPGDQLRI